MKKNNHPKISVVIPLFEPEKKVFEKVKEMLGKQTIKADEIIENWNMPEAKSINTGIRKAKGDIIVVLEQDCVPKTKVWLEKLTTPLKDKNIVGVVSDLTLPEEQWKKYPFFLRLLIINERGIQHPDCDIRACAYRKKELIELGLINENPKAGADTELYMKLKKIGKIVRANEIIYHLHNQKNFKNVLKKIYNYAEGNGKMVRIYTTKLALYDIGMRVVRVLPFFGMISIIFRFPFKKYFYLFPAYLIIALPLIHLINIIGFWKGFFSKKDFFI
ncbi:glycosyltransferase [Candidatus Pacearchaeota archaeon]|nr:glycosyltransferase [Candidatus Pacearchaeota archaeon]